MVYYRNNKTRQNRKISRFMTYQKIICIKKSPQFCELFLLLVSALLIAEVGYAQQVVYVGYSLFQCFFNQRVNFFGCFRQVRRIDNQSLFAHSFHQLGGYTAVGFQLNVVEVFCKSRRESFCTVAFWCFPSSIFSIFRDWTQEPFCMRRRISSISTYCTMA